MPMRDLGAITVRSSFAFGRDVDAFIQTFYSD